MHTQKENISAVLFTQKVIHSSTLIMDNQQVFIVDLQFVQGNEKQYFIKELAILKKGSLIPIVYHFKAPYPEEELNNEAKYNIQYSENKINGLKWNSGTVEYLGLKDILKYYLQSADIIYVKGKQKKNFLEKYIDSTKINDLTNTMPSLLKIENFKSMCPIPTHSVSSSLRCAIKNSFNIYMHLLKENVLN